jgi:hypothetical protein
MAKKSNQFSVFGTRPDNAICLPDIPYSVRLNCKDGGLFVGGYEAQHRKTNPDQKIEISIIKVSKFFGTLGKTENVLWLQLFFVAAPNVDSSILPKNTVCCTWRMTTIRELKGHIDLKELYSNSLAHIT